MKKGRFRNWLAVMRQYAREKRAVFVTYLVLRLIVAAALVLSIVSGNYDSAFICVLALLLFLLPAFIEDRFQVTLPSLLEIIVLLFIFAAEILGELSAYYVRFPHWDTILHSTWGFLCAAVGFSLVDVLNRSERVKLSLSPVFLALVAFCFSMTIGVFWEFIEFGADRLFHLDMQKDTVIHAFSSVALDPTLSNTPVRLEDIRSAAVNGEELGLGGYLDIGLYDTMEDLFVNFIGALVFSVIGYFDARSHGGSRLTAGLVPRLKKEGEERNKR